MIYVSITRVIVNNMCGLCRGFANKVLMVQWGCNHQNTYFGSLLHTKIFERNLHLQKDSQNICARSPSRNSQDFATRILQRNSQIQYPISLIRNPQELYKEPSREPVRPELTLSFGKDLSGYATLYKNSFNNYIQAVSKDRTPLCGHTVWEKRFTARGD